MKQTYVRLMFIMVMPGLIWGRIFNQVDTSFTPMHEVNVNTNVNLVPCLKQVRTQPQIESLP